MGAEKKNGFIFYETFYDAIKDLPDKTRLRFFDAIAEFGLTGIIPVFEGLEKAVWVQMEFSLIKAKKRYDANVLNGGKGGAPKGNKNAKKLTQNNPELTQNNPELTQNNPETTQNNPETTQNNLNDNVNVNVNDNVNVNGNVNVKEATPPTTILENFFDESGIVKIKDSLQARNLDLNYVLFVHKALKRKRFKGWGFETLPQGDKKKLFFKALTDWKDFEKLYKEKGMEGLQELAGTLVDESLENMVVDF